MHASMEDTIASESQVSIMMASGFFVIRFSTSFIWMVGSSCASVIYSSIPCSSAAFWTPSLTSTKNGLVCVFMARPIPYFFPLPSSEPAFSASAEVSFASSFASSLDSSFAASVVAAAVVSPEPELHPAISEHAIASASTVAPICFLIIQSPFLKKIFCNGSAVSRINRMNRQNRRYLILLARFRVLLLSIYTNLY